MKKILAADIGGTNSRFASFTTDGLSLVLEDMLRLPTRQFGSFMELVDVLESEGFPASPRRSDVTVIAVAGAVHRRVRAKPPNIPWEIDFTYGRDVFGEGGYYLINDFVAQAFGCQTDAVSDAREIKPGMPQDNAALAAVGAGTGLGHCALLPDLCGGYLAAPSEAGHASFAFNGPEEQEYERFLLAKTGKPYAYGDLVVTGLGLSLLHHFLTGDDLEPAGVSTRLSEDCATTAWFARFYGRACRNYALSVLAMRGVYVVGGVAAKNPMLVMHPDFRREFTESPNYAWLLQEIPVYLVENEDSGLWGAAFYGLLNLR